MQRISFVMTVIVFLIVSILSQAAFAQDADLTFTMEPVNAFGTQDAVDDAFSVVVRNGDEVAMMFHTSDLIPGDAVTAWWVIFNNPAACSDGVCNGDDLPQNGGAPDVQAAMILADGQIVDEAGQARFTARLDVADTSKAYAFETEGLTAIDQAEIHLVARTHGPALEDPDLLAAQLASLNGGCENGSEASGLPGPNTCSNVLSSIHIAGA